MTDLLYLRDAYLHSFEATVLALDEARIALDRTAFYPTGGGQPHDTGELRWDGGSARVTGVQKKNDVVWHTLEGVAPAVDTAVAGTIDWDRRHQLMRTHSAMHIVCGVVLNEWNTLVTGNNMEPLAGRIDLDFDPLPDGFADTLQAAVNAAIATDHPIEVAFLSRAVALADDALIRTKVNLIPESVSEIRVVDIVGLDKQADGGTHVRSTGEIGRFEITKIESKGKANKRVRFTVA